MGPSPSGYGHPAYAAAVADGRTVRTLPRCGGALIVREIGQEGRQDAVGPYPIFSCPDWSGLDRDLSELASDLVSVAIVADPFGGWTEDLLRRAFPEVLLRFKEHYVVRLGTDPLAHVHPHHRRNVSLGRRAVEVDVVSDLEAFAPDWEALYRDLVARHEIVGPAAFSARSLAAQLLVPGMVALRARRAAETVGACLWYEQGDVAYYHLAAYAPAGYELRASYALFARAFELFAERGLAWASLGAGAGSSADPSDGLSRFKRGWSTGTRVAWFGGRILQPDVYDRLARAVPSAGHWFPSYRQGEVE
jgi:Acetyltransferase (GNAT) domain